MLLFLQISWLLLILSIAAWQDIKTRTVSNRLVLIGFIGLVGLQILGQSMHLLSLIIGILIGLTLWKFKFFGGGDSKLIMLISAAFLHTELITLYSFIAVIGALQALWFLKYKPQKTLPYAVAILMGTGGYLVFKIWA